MKVDWINIPQIEEESQQTLGELRIFVTIDVCKYSQAPFFTITHYTLNGERMNYGRLGPMDDWIYALAHKHWSEDLLSEIINHDDEFLYHLQARFDDDQRRRAEWRDAMR